MAGATGMCWTRDGAFTWHLKPRPHACPCPLIPPTLPQECLAGLNSDPSSQLECAPLDLSRPLPMDPLDAVALGSGGGGAAEGGHAAPSDGSGGSENLDEGGLLLGMHGRRQLVPSSSGSQTGAQVALMGDP